MIRCVYNTMLFVRKHKFTLFIVLVTYSNNVPKHISCEFGRNERAGRENPLPTLFTNSPVSYQFT